MRSADGTPAGVLGRAHAEVFLGHPPATTMVEVAGLIDPAMLIEIEAEAYSASTSAGTMSSTS